MNGRACAAPGCVALATDDGLCNVHARLTSGKLKVVQEPDPAERNRRLAESLMSTLKQTNPEVAGFVSAIHAAPIEVPALVRFEFHSPFGALTVCERLTEQEFVFAVGHVLEHVRQQIERFGDPM